MDRPLGGSPVTARAQRSQSVRWTDSRLLLGVLLVLGSVVVGTRVVASAQQTRPVWAAVRDLPAGVVLGADDLVLAQVRLDQVSARYLTGASPVGRALVRPVGAGELLPNGAVGDTGAGGDVGGVLHLVSVPVQDAHYPPGLARGDQVDVYVTSRDVDSGGQTSAAGARRVLGGAVVVEVGGGSSALRDPGATVAVVVAVPDGSVPDLVGAIRSGDVDLVLVSGAQP